MQRKTQCSVLFINKKRINTRTQSYFNMLSYYSNTNDKQKNIKSKKSKCKRNCAKIRNTYNKVII